MTRDLDRLRRDVFDLLVVGGGIYGLATAYDAAQRGLSVALVERDDFGGRTTFNHHKTLHGGLRHLQRGHLVRMRESVRERRAFARIAPQFIAPQPFLVATRGRLSRSRPAMAVAFAVDRVVGFDRNRDVPRELVLSPGRVLTRAAASELAPQAGLDRSTGGALWYDYRMDESERLTFAFALAAARHGAVLVNYAEAVEACREGSQVTGMRVRDAVSGEAIVVRARVTCNATGAGAGRLMSAFGVRKPFPLVKAMNVVTRRPAWRVAVGAPTREGRLLIALPWRDSLAIGTSHGSEQAGADATTVSARELQAFLDEINEAFPGLALVSEDVTLVHRGVVPARVRGGRPELLEHSLVIDHATDGIEGAVTLVGVKYTTARLTAERVVDLSIGKVGLQPVPCSTADVPLIPLDSDQDGQGDELAQLRRLYDPDAFGRLTALAAARPELGRRLAPEVAVLGVQVVEAVRHEMALTVEDVLLRRTAAGSVGHPGAVAVGAAAAIMQAELGWSSSRVEDEVEALKRYYEVLPDSETGAGSGRPERVEHPGHAGRESE
jgi:glycerol-3-phosphate dehydrogenase